MSDRYKMKLPAWTKNLPDNSAMNIKEVSSFFGFKQSNHLHALVSKGQFPEHDFTSHRNLKIKKPFYNWSMGLLRKFERSQDNITVD